MSGAASDEALLDNGTYAEDQEPLIEDKQDAYKQQTRPVHPSQAAHHDFQQVGYHPGPQRVLQQGQYPQEKFTHGQYPQGQLPQGQYPQCQQGVPVEYSQPPPYPANAYPQGLQGCESGTVVMHQPAVLAPVERPRREPEYGIIAIIIAVLATGCFGISFCWWSLPFTIGGIIFGIISSFYGDKGEKKTAKTHFYISIGCTVAGVIAMVIGVGVGIALYATVYRSRANNYY